MYIPIGAENGRTGLWTLSYLLTILLVTKLIFWPLYLYIGSEFRRGKWV